MNKILNYLYVICFRVLDTFTNFLFLIRILLELKHLPFYFKADLIRVLLQFFATPLGNSYFELYCSENEQFYFQFYYSLKKKNSAFFQGLCLLHCCFFNNLLYPICYKLFCKKINVDRYFIKVNEKINKQIENNFGYTYLREYKIYWKDKLAIYKSIRFKIFIKETLLNLFIGWNKVITKDNSKSKLFINTDNLFFDIERYF